MAIDMTLDRHPVVAALSRVDETIDETTEAGVWSLCDADLLAALEASERLGARLAGLQLRLVAEADTRGVAAAQGAPCTAALLRHRLRLDPKDAKDRVALAGDPDLARARAALCAGDISAAHARVVRQAVGALPATVGAAVRGEAVEFLVGEAAGRVRWSV